MYMYMYMLMYMLIFLYTYTRIHTVEQQHVAKEHVAYEEKRNRRICDEDAVLVFAEEATRDGGRP